MRRPRLGPTLAAVALFLLAAGLGVGVRGASGADPLPNTGITQLSSDHFTIYFSRNKETTCPTRFITAEQAGEVLRMAERAYAFYGSWAYTPPSYAPVHISVDEFDKAPPTCITDGVIDPLLPKNPDDGTLTTWDGFINPVVPAGADEIHLDGTNGRGLGYRTIAREVFYLFGRVMKPSLWDPPPAPNNQWLPAASAEWTAFRTDGFATVTATDLAGRPGRSLDCVGTECGTGDADRNGYSGWLFMEYLAERFGNDAVREVWNAPGTGLTQLSNLLAAHGTTLTTFFNDFAAARLAGKFTVTTMAGALPPTHDPPIAVPQASGAISGIALSVNHLAAAYAKLTHGTDAAAACYEATLTLTIGIPAGVTSVPYYYANTQGAVAQPFGVSGSTASLTVPWNTCAGSPAAYVALPNPSLLDAREFVLNGSVTVDKTKPATPSEAPAQVPIGTPVTVVPTSDPPPTLSLHAPEVLRVSAKTRLLRFIVFSSGDGKLQAALGSTSLGSPTVHAGNNDVRFVLPKQLFKTLRAKSSNNVLALTSLSTSGAKGMTVTRRVVVQTPPKPKRRR
jgi:hypothetical protein